MDWTSSIETTSGAADAAQVVTNPDLQRGPGNGSRRVRVRLLDLEPEPRPDPGRPGDGPETFDQFQAAIRRELSPHGLLETVLADLVARAAWGLQAAGFQAAPAAEAPEPPDRLTETLIRALDTFNRFRDGRRAGWNGSGRLQPSPARTFLDDPTPSDDGRWRERLAFDLEVSETSPVVKGTWVTAGQVVSLIVDGWSWADILRAHPELTEEDIRACLAYTIENEE